MSTINAYCWIIIALFVMSAIGRLILFFRTDKVSKTELLESSLGLVNSVGLYGFIENRHYFNGLFWWFALVASLLIGFYTIFFSPKTKELIEKLGKKGRWLMAASYVVTAPHLVILFFYANSWKSM